MKTWHKKLSNTRKMLKKSTKKRTSWSKKTAKWSVTFQNVTLLLRICAHN